MRNSWLLWVSPTSTCTLLFADMIQMFGCACKFYSVRDLVCACGMCHSDTEYMSSRALYSHSTCKCIWWMYSNVYWSTHAHKNDNMHSRVTERSSGPYNASVWPTSICSHPGFYSSTFRGNRNTGFLKFTLRTTQDGWVHMAGKYLQYAKLQCNAKYGLHPLFIPWKNSVFGRAVTTGRWLVFSVVYWQGKWGVDTRWDGVCVCVLAQIWSVH